MMVKVQSKHKIGEENCTFQMRRLQSLVEFRTITKDFSNADVYAYKNKLFLVSRQVRWMLAGVRVRNFVPMLIP
jgi:hypothetical protein